jgi:hypothetical protein
VCFLVDHGEEEASMVGGCSLQCLWTVAARVMEEEYLNGPVLSFSEFRCEPFLESEIRRGLEEWLE